MSKLVQNYLLQQPIGKGVYGQVFRAIHQKSKQDYAVKVIPKSSFKANPKLEQLAINEINILSTLKNENIVRFIETLKTPNNFYFVYEYCNGGTLQSLLQKKKTLKEDEALIVFRQLLEAFKQLNKNNIMHRDLKPDNIFFNEGKVKLGDFGFCKMLEVNMAQTMLGSPIYMAPEILKQEIYTLKADIWSLGVVLFEMLFGYCPFESSSISQLINVIKDTELAIPKQINPISDQCETLIRKMLVKDQFKRIEWVDLFDFNIDDQGRIISGYKKDLGIEALEKYFLLDIKSATEVEFAEKKVLSPSEQIQKVFKDGVESDKIIFSNKELSDKKISRQRLNGSNNPQTQVMPESRQTQQSGQTHFNRTQGQPFIQRHSRWLRGVQLLDQLTDCSDSQAETIFYHLILGMIKQINEQYHSHPEWTDVLMEERRCLTDSLKSIGKQQTFVDAEEEKAELLKIWRKGEQKWKLMWGRAIRFIFNSQGNSQIPIETLLS